MQDKTDRAQARQTPPSPSDTASNPAVSDRDGAVFSVCGDAPVQLETLRNRPDFLRAASARRQGAAGFLLQARRRAPDETPGSPVRVGFTCSKKIGNAVMRNRAKRRLRALAREIMPHAACQGWDYVLVARPGATVARDYGDLRQDLVQALSRIHAPRSAPVSGAR